MDGREMNEAIIFLTKNMENSNLNNQNFDLKRRKFWPETDNFELKKTKTCTK